MTWVILIPHTMSSVSYYPAYEKKEWIVEQEFPLEMLDSRYGRIVTKQKGARELQRKPYSKLAVSVKLTDSARDYERRMQESNPDFNLEYNPKEAWDLWQPIFDNGITDREEYLYDLVDTQTGFVIMRGFKGNCRKLLDSGIELFDRTKDYVTIGFETKAKKVLKQVCVYKTGNMTIVAHNKYKLKEIS